MEHEFVIILNDDEISDLPLFSKMVRDDPKEARELIAAWVQANVGQIEEFIEEGR